MKERSIIMSGPEALATLAGKKTQARRALTAPRIDNIQQWNLLRMQDGYPDGVPRAVFEDGEDPVGIACPFGAPGDRLWVKEAWALEELGDDGERVVWRADRAAAWRGSTTSP